jgi:glycine oxidase
MQVPRYDGETPTIVEKADARGDAVIVVGAGLIGLAIAFELAERGISVRVYERGEPARAASWAGAGMLAPYTEHIEDETLLALCDASLALYPRFVERVRDASGIDAQLQLDGIVHAAFDRAGFDRLRSHAEKLQARGVRVDVLGREQTLTAEPALGKHTTGSIVVHGEGYVDNRRLGRALAAACEHAGVTVERNVHDLAVECDGRRVLGVRSHLGFASASTVINATGAWAAALPGVPIACAPNVEPVKGQMCALAIPRGFVRRTVWVPGAYFVPRADGRLLIGATMERRGFDVRVTADGMHALLGNALAAAPALGAFAVTETWAGLRPGSPDERPFLGPTPLEGLLLATGHYRNGILLTPVTAQRIADFVATGDATPLEPFLLARSETEETSAARISRA